MLSGSALLKKFLNIAATRLDACGNRMALRANRKGLRDLLFKDTTEWMKKDFTSKIIKALYEVHNELGPGFLEQVYQSALRIVFEQYELRCEFEKKVEVTFRDQRIGAYFADVIVEDEVVLELKAVKELCPEHSAQLINYLKAGQYKTGLLINFGAPKLDFKRLYS